MSPLCSLPFYPRHTLCDLSAFLWAFLTPNTFYIHFFRVNYGLVTPRPPTRRTTCGPITFGLGTPRPPTHRDEGRCTVPSPLKLAIGIDFLTSVINYDIHTYNFTTLLLFLLITCLYHVRLTIFIKYK